MQSHSQMQNCPMHNSLRRDKPHTALVDGANLNKANDMERAILKHFANEITAVSFEGLGAGMAGVEIRTRDRLNHIEYRRLARKLASFIRDIRQDKTLVEVSYDVNGVNVSKYF